MSLCVTETGTELGVDHAWEFVQRGASTLNAAGPFDLASAHAIEWRVRDFLFEASLEARPGPTGDYEPAVALNAVVRVGLIFQGVTILEGIPNELGYVCFRENGTGQTIYEPEGGGHGIHMFERNAVSAGSAQSAFYYIPGLGFYIGVYAAFQGPEGTSELSTLVSDTSGKTEQGLVTFNVFNMRVPVYSESDDAGQWSGTITISAFSFWPYYDSRTGLDTYDTATGVVLNPVPNYM